MGRLKNRITEAGQLWGLPHHMNQQSVFGSKEGLGVQMLAGREGKAEAFIGIVRWNGPEQDSFVLEKFKKSEVLREAKVKPTQIKVSEGMAVYTVPFAFSFGLPSAQQMVERMQALVNEVKSVVGTISPVCRICRSGAPEPVLINGRVDRLCANCLHKAQVQAQEREAAYNALATRWVRALFAGGMLALLGAVVWDGVIVFTHRMFWILAIGIGAVIGWGTTKAAGKGGMGIQVLSGLFTVLSVAGGMAILVALGANAESIKNGAFDAQLFQANFMKGLTESIGDLAFALGGGLIGAATAVQRAGKPKFEMSVEK